MKAIKTNVSPLFAHNNQHSPSIELYCPTSMPNASAYLWNSKMMLQMSCRGYANAQHMQPEPAKYSYAQSLEAKTFMQPEHHYHSSHPGRFFYIKVKGQAMFSLPYEPMRVPVAKYQFAQGLDDISWRIEQYGLIFELSVKLGNDDALETWQLNVMNTTQMAVDVDIFPCFSLGYASWMNQSATFNSELNAIVGTYVTPYQKVEDYYKNANLKDKTVLIASAKVASFDTCLHAFEGEGGIHNPSALAHDALGNSVALYQTPVAVMQHTLHLAPKHGINKLAWLFAPVKDEAEAKQLKSRYFAKNHIEEVDASGKASPLRQIPALVEASKYTIKTEFADFDAFVNTWLVRQIQYHCQANRLTRDPQTRNYLQDHMVEVLTNPSKARESFLFALAQQSMDGAMPDGILLAPDAELKYINQIPHSDHNIWLFIYLDTYLAHSNDLSILQEMVGYSDSKNQQSVFEHLRIAAEYLYANIDYRSLCFIEQGDWCDPMNMVGKDGKGVSIWLTLASAYAFGLFAKVCEQAGNIAQATIWHKRKEAFNEAVNKHAWDGNWYARGISDNGRMFGIEADAEGQIYLNPQAWSMLSGAANKEQLSKLMSAVDQKLATPFGVAMLAPAYTQMDEDIGRLTQKFPGTAENGSVYNHAACFYAYALLANGFAEQGFDVLKKMLIEEPEALSKQQLPNFVPNYFRGAYYQYPEVAGRSSHLFNTGTCSWYYRCVIELIFGISHAQHKQGLNIRPCMPKILGNAEICLSAFGSELTIEYRPQKELQEIYIHAKEGVMQNSSAEKSPVEKPSALHINGHEVTGFEAGKHYRLVVTFTQQQDQ